MHIYIYTHTLYIIYILCASWVRTTGPGREQKRGKHTEGLPVPGILGEAPSAAAVSRCEQTLGKKQLIIRARRFLGRGLWVVVQPTVCQVLEGSSGESHRNVHFVTGVAV